MNRLALIFFSFFFVLTGYSEDAELVGTIEQTVTLPSVKDPSKKIKKVLIMDKWEISGNLAYHFKHDINLLSTNNSASLEGQEYTAPASSRDLGMNGVPVLDQGPFGTCVIFSTSAAIDAILGKGDYVSQVCALQLGRYLEDNAYAVSGWQGSQIGHFTQHLNLFGIVNKNMQSSSGCGGLTTYPRRSDQDLGQAMTPDAYKKISEDLDDYNLYLTTLIDIPHFMRQKYNPNLLLSQIKASINEGDRIIISSFIVSPNSGLGGATGSYRAKNDTWLLSKSLHQNFSEGSQSLGAHAMVLIGYDDNAVVVDNEGLPHRGLIKLRNSWGKNAGDQGNFYMTYDYVKMFMSEAYRVSR